ncbi:sugar phosphate isomerase/epimerase [Spiractinospora alimapuensis]|uniref:sugar phosphate isomerase/epimerase family protein n=1 Tax=Spiractinospora alimapuensis TaxID=2820884 RepID=UPI001F23C9DC|nr:TIM barrel protein [Spiractinospora alimapuensis]QVQ54479.1 sugar phosphate isomerase/epimerase [Spiractinospora alimapuensis]
MSNGRTTSFGLTLAGYGISSEVDFGERVRAAAAAGFTGVGLRAEDYVRAGADGYSDDAMDAVLARHGVALTETEYVTSWGRSVDRDEAQREKERTIFHMARRFGVPHVNTGLLEHLPEEDIVAALRDLCDRAEELVVAVEFMPYSGIPDLGTAAWVAERCGRENVALIIDAWHWARAESTSADLDVVPPGDVASIQLCDVGPTPLHPLRTESLHHRWLPGQGHGDVVGLLRDLAARDIRPDLLSVEVISDELTRRGPDAAARAAYTAAREVLEAAEYT